MYVFSNEKLDTVTKCLNDSTDIDKLLHNIIYFSETEGVTDNALTEYAVTLLAQNGGILEKIVRSGTKVGEDLCRAACSDLEKVFASIEQISEKFPKYSPSALSKRFSADYTESIRKMCLAKTPEELLDLLIDYYKHHSAGELAKFSAFKYEGTLKGISKVEKVTLDDLVGLEYQKNVLIENTTALLRGRRANNVLLFGDMGTGKSTSVKALLNMYAKDGLRVIEMPKEYISDLPALTAELADNPDKYIIFLDDLSFETHEKDYRALKIAMEGQLFENPQNVVIYATSNRRHLIKETWSDRNGDDVHRNDNMQETLSLAERFGISLVFTAPTSQKEYLGIVKELLSKGGVEMTDEISRAAVIWQMNYGSRSGRCAKQFVASYLSKVE